MSEGRCRLPSDGQDSHSLVKVSVDAALESMMPSWVTD